MMHFKFVSQVGGGHTHVTVYAGKQPGALGNCGNLSFENDEWKVFKELFYSDPKARQENYVEFTERVV